MTSPIPIIDVGPLREGAAGLRHVAGEIGAACRGIGFFYVRNSGVPGALRTAVFEAAHRFFAADAPLKESVSIARSPHNRGYVGMSAEALDPARGPDRKEAFNIGLERAPDDPEIAAGRPFRGVNLWPDLPGFRETLLAYYDAVWALGRDLHRAVAVDLGLDADAFADKLDRPMATLRLLHYPAAPPGAGGLGAGEHTDYGNLTLLATDALDQRRLRLDPASRGEFRRTGALFGRVLPRRQPGRPGGVPAVLRVGRTACALPGTARGRLPPGASRRNVSPRLGHIAGYALTEKITKAQAIYGALLDDIEMGRLPPGRALDEVQMARVYGVSRTPIREAIRRLELTGLVDTRSHRGTVVRGLSDKQLDDMFAVMAELEALCARWASLAMSTAQRKQLAALHAGALVFVAQDDHEAYAEANISFHSAIYDGAGNDFLADLVRTMRRRAAPFRNLQFQAPGRIARSHREHGRVADAILKGHADEAYRAMRAHIVVVRSAVDDVLGAGGLDEADV